MLYTTMRLALLDWFKDTSGLSATIWADQASPRPGKPFAALKLISGPIRRGILDSVHQRGSNADTTKAAINGLRAYTLECQVFSNTMGQPQDILDDVVLSISDETKRELLKRRGSYTIDVTSAIDATAYIVYVDEIGITYTSGVGATLLSIRNGIVAAINANTYIDQRITAENGSTDAEFIVTAIAGLDLLVTVGSRLAITDSVEAYQCTIWGDSGVLDLSETQETIWEYRAQVDLFFDVTVRRLVDLGLIETVTILNEMSGDTFTVAKT